MKIPDFKILTNKKYYTSHNIICQQFPAMQGNGLDNKSYQLKFSGVFHHYPLLGLEVATRSNISLCLREDL